MTIVLILIALLYSLVIGSLILGFLREKLFVPNNGMDISFSVIIPFRNEASNLPALLESLSELEYKPSNYELIFVDDDSEDHSVSLINEFRGSNTHLTVSILKNLPNTKAPKKTAIELAIRNSKHEWILSTDADCQMGPKWLSAYSSFIQQEKAELIAGPVAYTEVSTWLDHFQNFDMMSLQFATIGGFGIGQPFMCNGANFAYKKNLFLELNGFKDNDHIGSGDDVFLLHKAHSKSKAVRYLKSKNAIIWTKSQPSLHELFQQRKRWAAKTASYSNLFSKLVAFAVLIMNLGVLVFFAAFLYGSISLSMALYFLSLKLLFDLLAVNLVSKFFNKPICFQYFILSFIFYPLFVLLVGISSMISGYKWKDRSYNQ